MYPALGHCDFFFLSFFLKKFLFYYGQHAGRAANSWAQTLLTQVRDRLFTFIGNFPSKGHSTISYRNFKNFNRESFRNDIAQRGWTCNGSDDPNVLWADWNTKFFRGTQRQFSVNICSEDDLRSRIFGTFVVKFLLACLP